MTQLKNSLKIKNSIAKKKPFLRIKKNLVTGHCRVCQQPFKIYKYAKTILNCKLCMNLLVKPTSNKGAFLGKKVEVKSLKDLSKKEFTDLPDDLVKL